MSKGNKRIRTLEEICDSLSLKSKKLGFCIEVNRNKYCMLGMSKKIECSRQSGTKDPNGLYLCLKHIIKKSNLEQLSDGQFYNA